MPKRIYSLLSQHDTVQHGIPGLIDVLANLLNSDPSITSADLCHPDLQYIGKIKDGIWGEGYDFCGYQNIQMQISYLSCVRPSECEAFGVGVPSILRLQDYIEEAWDRGINARGRIETGGIRGTRKHVGTLEAQALFKRFGIATRARTFQNKRDGNTAFEQLLQYVDGYFQGGEITVPHSVKVRRTALPPIYLQRPRHSMTVVGISRSENGSKALLVFDPAVTSSKSSKPIAKRQGEFLKLFSRGESEMKRFSGFETLALDLPVAQIVGNTQPVANIHDPAA